MKARSSYLKNKFLIILFVFVFFSCKTFKNTLLIEKLNVSFLGGNNYPKKNNEGSIDIHVTTSDTSISTLKKFDSYSPLNEPVIIKLAQKNNTIILSDKNGNEFALAFTDSTEKNCHYNCKAVFYKEDKISFTSQLASFPYWHGLSVLGGHPLFMRHFYYTLVIKKPDGKKLKMQWTYSRQKYKPYNSRHKKWSNDYCVDNGGGLTLLKIK